MAVSFKSLVQATVKATHDGLQDLMETIGHEVSEEERMQTRAKLIFFFQCVEIRFARLLALYHWITNNADMFVKLNDLSLFLDDKDAHFHLASERYGLIANQLYEQCYPIWDVYSATHVLSTGSYSLLPKGLNSIVPTQEESDPVDRLQHFVRIALLLPGALPTQLKAADFNNQGALCLVDILGRFSVDVSMRMVNESLCDPYLSFKEWGRLRFVVLSVSIKISPKGNLCEITSKQTETLIDKLNTSLSAIPLSSKPLFNLFNLLSKFVSHLTLDYLKLQLPDIFRDPSLIVTPQQNVDTIFSLKMWSCPLTCLVFFEINDSDLQSYAKVGDFSIDIELNYSDLSLKQLIEHVMHQHAKRICELVHHHLFLSINGDPFFNLDLVLYPIPTIFLCFHNSFTIRFDFNFITGLLVLSSGHFSFPNSLKNFEKFINNELFPTFCTSQEELSVSDRLSSEVCDVKFAVIFHFLLVNLLSNLSSSRIPPKHLLFIPKHFPDRQFLFSRHPLLLCAYIVFGLHYSGNHFIFAVASSSTSYSLLPLNSLLLNSCSGDWNNNLCCVSSQTPLSDQDILKIDHSVVVNLVRNISVCILYYLTFQLNILPVMLGLEMKELKSVSPISDTSYRFDSPITFAGYPKHPIDIIAKLESQAFIIRLNHPACAVLSPFVIMPNNSINRFPSIIASQDDSECIIFEYQFFAFNSIALLSSHLSLFVALSDVVLSMFIANKRIQQKSKTICDFFSVSSFSFVDATISIKYLDRFVIFTHVNKKYTLDFEPDEPLNAAFLRKAVHSSNVFDSSVFLPIFQTSKILPAIHMFSTGIALLDAANGFKCSIVPVPVDATTIRLYSVFRDFLSNHSSFFTIYGTENANFAEDFTYSSLKGKNRLVNHEAADCHSFLSSWLSRIGLERQFKLLFEIFPEGTANKLLDSSGISFDQATQPTSLIAPSVSLVLQKNFLAYDFTRILLQYASRFIFSPPFYPESLASFIRILLVEFGALKQVVQLMEFILNNEIHSVDLCLNSIVDGYTWSFSPPPLRVLWGLVLFFRDGQFAHIPLVILLDSNQVSLWKRQKSQNMRLSDKLWNNASLLDVVREINSLTFSEIKALEAKCV